MNLFETLKPEVLKAVNEYAEKFPMSGADLIEELFSNDYLHNVRYGYVTELMGLMPYKEHQTPYDLFSRD